MVPRYRFVPFRLGEDRGGEREVVRQDGQGGKEVMAVKRYKEW